MCSEIDLNVPIVFRPNVNMEVLGRVAQERSIAKMDTFIQDALAHTHTFI